MVPSNTDNSTLSCGPAVGSLVYRREVFLLGINKNHTYSYINISNVKMARIKIKATNSKDPGRKHKLLEILASNEIYVTRIIPKPDAFIIPTNNDNEMDKIFNNKTDKQLKELDFLTQIPFLLKANRSVILSRVDNHIIDHGEEEIKEEIIKQNPWVQSISQILKFPRGNTKNRLRRNI